MLTLRLVWRNPGGSAYDFFWCVKHGANIGSEFDRQLRTIPQATTEIAVYNAPLTADFELLYRTLVRMRVVTICLCNQLSAHVLCEALCHPKCAIEVLDIAGAAMCTADRLARVFRTNTSLRHVQFDSATVGRALPLSSVVEAVSVPVTNILTHDDWWRLFMMPSMNCVRCARFTPKALGVHRTAWPDGVFESDGSYIKTPDVQPYEERQSRGWGPVSV